MSTSDPRENRYMGEVEDTGYDDMSMADDYVKDCEEGRISYSSAGLCPCCGCELEEHIPYEFSEGVFQRCHCCDWESDIVYDL